MSKKFAPFFIALLLLQAVLFQTDPISTTVKPETTNRDEVGALHRNSNLEKGYDRQESAKSKEEYLALFTGQKAKERFVKSNPEITIIHKYELLPLVLIKDVKTRLNALQKDPLTLSIIPNREITLPSPLQTKNSRGVTPLSSSSSKAIGADYLWNKGYQGNGTKIAIIDTGIAHHKEFEGRIDAEKSFVKEKYGYDANLGPTENLHWHGTAVAGVAAGAGKQDKGQGVAPNASLLNARVFPKKGSATFAGIIAAIEWAVQHDADVINLSLGTSAPVWYIDPVVDAVNAAMRQGVTVVAAAGNAGGGGTWSMSVGSPGSATEIITVGATNQNNTGPIQYYSSIGPGIHANVKPDVSAPSNVYSTTLNNEYTTDRVAGTSFSAPHVAGAAALLTQYLTDRGLTNNLPSLIKSTLMQTADPVTSNNEKCNDLWAGAGAINLTSAYDYLDAKSGRPHALSITPAHVPIGLTNQSTAFYPYATKLFQGERLAFNFTLTTSYNTTVNVSYTGNMTTALDIHSPNSFTLQSPTTLWEFNASVTQVPEGYYQGRINFTVGEKSVIVPMHFQLRTPETKILWDIRHTTWMNDFIYGQYRHLYQQFVELNASVDTWYYRSSRSPSSVLDSSKYDLVFMPDTASYYPQWPSNGTILGEKSILFSKIEIQAFRDYVKEGGYLAMVTMGRNSNNFTDLNQLARRFGFEFTGTTSGTVSRLEVAEEVRGHLLTRGVDQFAHLGARINIRNPMTLPIAKKGNNPVMTYTQMVNGGVFASATNLLFDNQRFEEAQYKESSKNLVRNLMNLSKHGATYIHDITGSPTLPSLGDEISVDINATSEVTGITGLKSDYFGLQEFNVNPSGGNYSGSFQQERIGGQIRLGANLTLSQGWLLGFLNETLTVQFGSTPPTITGKITTPGYTNGSTEDWELDAIDIEFHIRDDERLNYTGIYGKLLTIGTRNTPQVNILNINNTTWRVQVSYSQEDIRNIMTRYHGLLDLNLSALDLATNEEATSIQLQLNDPSLPSIDITSPENATVLSTQDFEVRWNGSDRESGIGHYEVQVDNGSWKSVSYENYHFYGVAEGSHQIRVKAVNGMEMNATDVVNLTIDPYTPTLSITNPEGGATINGVDVTVEWEASDNVTKINYYEVKLDSRTWEEVGRSTNHTFTGLEKEEHQVKVKAVDMAGNNATDTVTFTVQGEQQPEGEQLLLTYIGIGAGVGIAIAIGIVVFYFVRKKHSS